jgi:hypothetical protein
MDYLITVPSINLVIKTFFNGARGWLWHYFVWTTSVVVSSLLYFCRNIDFTKQIVTIN